MLARSLWLTSFLAVSSYGQSSSDITSSVVVLSGTATSDNSLYAVPTGSYQSIGTSQIVDTELYGSLSTSSSRTVSGRTTASASLTSSSLSPGSTSTRTLLVGGGGIVTELIINGTTTSSSQLNTTTSATGSSTSTAAAPTNTQPCNGYTEFCDRKYGNITEVCAHNSAFAIKGNAGSNQELGINVQLNDGIRMIQGETFLVNNTIYNCHSSCDLLNAGTWLSELEIIAEWVETHPYDVVTILIVNSEYVGVGNYTAPLQASGLAPYLYEPPYIPMRLDQWPTLSEMILTQKRVVVFMDYEAKQAEVPYILDQFTHMWETPFSPTNRSFPCTTQRPPNLDPAIAKNDLMYLANHNLNAEITLLGLDLLIPNSNEINVTNSAVNDYGTLEAMVGNCTADWDRPPNWLLVDFYNDGNVEGSVFEVAAKYNNVTYAGTCCGNTDSAASNLKRPAMALIAAFAAVFVFVI